MMNEMEFHPVSALFPELPENEFEALVADIVQNGLREPIHVMGKAIIDGRHRYRACLAAGIEPQFVQVAEHADLNALVISLNLRRRHLSESQRAMVAAKLASIERGHFNGNQHVVSANLPIPTLRQGAAADLLNVSERSLRNARTVQASGIPELASAVEQGDISVSAAAAVARLPEPTQQEIVRRTPDEIRSIAREVRDRIHDAGVVGPSAVRIFDKVAQEQKLTGIEQCAVVYAIKADTPDLPTPSEARRIAIAGDPGLMVLASDGRYHMAPGDPEENARFERWLVLREGLEPLGIMPLSPTEAIASIPAYQKQNVTAWLAHAVPFLNQLNQLWSQSHAQS
jgi:ParB-like chromosome segregation protein Spo0J